MNTGPESSWELVAAAQAGDREAFGRLYTRYRPGVARFVGSRVPDWAEAQDVTSETFTRAWACIGSVSDQGRDVGAWLTTIARNLVLDRAKSARVRYVTPTDDLPEPREGQYRCAPEPAELVVATQERAHRARLLSEWVNGLSADQRECVAHRFGEELNLAQTAVQMGRTVGAVKALQVRAIRRLRKSATHTGTGLVGSDQVDGVAVAGAPTDAGRAPGAGASVPAARREVRRAGRAITRARVPAPRVETAGAARVVEDTGRERAGSGTAVEVGA